jgi:hypothetical protein
LTSPAPRRGPYRHGAASSGWGALAGSTAPAGPRRQQVARGSGDLRLG